SSRSNKEAMKRIALTILAGCSACALLVVAGPEPIASSGKEVQELVAIAPITPWIGATLSGGDGMGMDDGTLTLEGFLPIYQSRDSQRHLVFLNGRVVLAHDF